MPPPTTTSGSTSTTGYDSFTKDSYIPIFSGQLHDYKEYRQRLKLYMAKMKLQKREAEGVINIIGSLTGTAWKLFETYDISDAEKDGAFDKMVKTMDKAFEYDNRVQLPNDFDRYFGGLQRKPGESLLQYVTNHDECYRKLEDHKVTLPVTVQGWHLLRRAGLTREQRQLVMTQAPTLEKVKVQEAMYLILGQDHRQVAGHHDRFRGRQYRAHYGDDESYDAGYYENDETYADYEEYDENEHGYYESQEYDEADYDEADDGNFDQDAAYFQNETTEDPTDTAAEYDSAYASYLDARKRFSDIKLARGFLPIVALWEGGSALSPGTSSPTSPPGKGKGKGSKGKAKGRGKWKGPVRYPSYPPKQADPRGRAQSAMTPQTCLRCGQTGHTTVNCPVPKTPSPNKKRPSPPTESTAVDAVVEPESGHVVFQDQHGRERWDCVMMDPGASAFLSGYGPFKRYMLMMQDKGYDLKELKFVQCDRKFFFDGDASSHCKWTAMLPVVIAGPHGLIQIYLLPGETPMLMGRPILENLGVFIDCKGKKICFEDSPWQDSVVGLHGEYLLPLQDDFDDLLLDQPPSFELVVPADGGLTGDPVDFDTFESQVKLFSDGPTENYVAPGEALLKRHQLTTMETKLNELSHQQQAYVTAEIQGPKQNRQRVLWEVYCGGARVSKIAATMGMITEEFSLATGWDFDDPKFRKHFLQRLHDEMPDEVYLSPTCGPWSQMQNLASRSEDQKMELQCRRQEHHDTHLTFCRDIYIAQVTNGRHAHLEQPKNALSWKTRALKTLPGYNAEFDQRMYGCCCLDTDMVWKAARKSTTVKTTKAIMMQMLSVHCDGSHDHCHLEGSAPGLGRRTTYMEDYQPSLAATIAGAILAPEAPQCWEMAAVVDEQRAVQGQLVKLYTENKAEAARTVQRLHRNLGHPSTKALTEMLESREASQAVIDAAKVYQCQACLRYKKPNQVAPASVPQAKDFGDRVIADVFWLKTDHKKVPVLSIIDQATKYQLPHWSKPSAVTTSSKPWNVDGFATLACPNAL